MIQDLGFRIQERKGQMLVEAVMALSVLTVGFLGVIALLSNSLGANRVVSDNYTAASLAGEGVELIKNLIDTNILHNAPWNSGLSNDTFEIDHASAALLPNLDRFLLFNPATGLYNYSNGTASKFKRTITISLTGTEEVKVNSIVRWTSRGGGSSEVNLEDHFLNWRP